MDKFVIILGLIVTIIMILLVSFSHYFDNKTYCGEKKGFFHRFYDFLDKSKIVNKKKKKIDSSFTVPVEQRPKLMYENGSDYYWSWQ